MKIFPSGRASNSARGMPTLRPPPFLQVLRLCEQIEDALARRVEDSFYDELLDRHFHDVIPCGHVASPSLAVPSGTRPVDRVVAPRSRDSARPTRRSP